MTKRIVTRTVAIGFLFSIATGCAVRPVVDPRSPAPVRDGAVVLRVCVVGETEAQALARPPAQPRQDPPAHLEVGDQVELTTNRLGRLRIRHLPRNPNTPAWNGGDDSAVKDAVLVEQVMPRGESKNTRRFVPVGRFTVDVPIGPHPAQFDFLASKAVSHLTGNEFPECNVPLGTDEVIIRGVGDNGRHGGHDILR
jgi:hypothetical protein